jgi:hypothetical protein
MTHSELVARAQKWLRSRRCHVVLVDVKTSVTNEQPDAIGWRSWSSSELVECKASRADFLRDKKKWFRRHDDLGMGHFRWYLATPHIIHADELPERWGLATVDSRGRISIAKNAQPFEGRALLTEMRLLITALRRATDGWGRSMFGDIAPPAVDGDPHPTASKIIRELRAENARLRNRQASG